MQGKCLLPPRGSTGCLERETREIARGSRSDGGGSSASNALNASSSSSSVSTNADGSGSCWSGICRADCTKAVGMLLGQRAVRNNTLLEISICTSWLAVTLLLKVSGGEVLFSSLSLHQQFLPPPYFLLSFYYPEYFLKSCYKLNHILSSFKTCICLQTNSQHRISSYTDVGFERIFL